MSPSCLVDTTFTPISRPYLSEWEYFNSKKNDHGFLYQVVVSLGKPFRILSFEGPFKGSAADVSIYRSTILPRLMNEEEVMTDRGYYQEETCWCPPTGKNLTQEDKIKRRHVTSIRHLNERVIGRVKMWGIMCRRWKHNWNLHMESAHVVSKLVQLELITDPLT